MDENKDQIRKKVMEHSEYLALKTRYDGILGAIEDMDIRLKSTQAENNVLGQKNADLQQQNTTKDQMISQQLLLKDQEVKRVELELIEVKAELKENKSAILKLITG